MLHEFSIAIHSFQDLQDFISLATVQPFEVLVGNDRQQISGKSFMGMMSLDLQNPLRVAVCCSDEEFTQFHDGAARFCV